MTTLKDSILINLLDFCNLEIFHSPEIENKEKFGKDNFHLSNYKLLLKKKSLKITEDKDMIYDLGVNLGRRGDV